VVVFWGELAHLAELAIWMGFPLAPKASMAENSSGPDKLFCNSEVTNKACGIEQIKFATSSVFHLLWRNPRAGKSVKIR